MLCRRHEKGLRICFILMLLNLPILRVVWVVCTLICSTIFISLSRHLHSRRICRHLIVSIFFLIRYIQGIHITQKDVTFVPDVAMYQITVRKQLRIFNSTTSGIRYRWYCSTWFTFHPASACCTLPRPRNKHSLVILTSFCLLTLHSLAFCLSG